MALAGCAGAVLGCAMPPATAQIESEMDLAIEAQTLADALMDLGFQSGIEVYFLRSEVAGISVGRLEGRYTLDEAVETLLGETAIPYRRDPNGTLLVGAAYVDNEEPQSAQAGAQRPEAVTNSGPQQPEETDEDEEQILGQVTVTGTNIRGVENPTVPIITLDRSYIEQSGFAATAQLFESLPQNLAGLSPSTAEIAASDISNRQNASAIDLRGLRPDATLVLINGRRLTPGGLAGVADISFIPLSAIERVDVLTDGASATYGADAVGGVVNFVLRDDFEGAETSVSYGLPTQEGGGQTFVASQLFGQAWGGGSAFIAYEYRTQANLVAAERDFAAQGPDFFNPSFIDLVPENTTHNVLANASHQLTERFWLSGHALHAERDSTGVRQIALAGFGGVQTADANVQQSSVFGELSYRFDNDLFLEFGAGFDRIETDVRNEFTEQDLLQTTTSDEAIRFDGGITGSLISLPAGDLSFAVGAEYASIENEQLILNNEGLDQSRETTSAYAELLVPLVSESNRMPLVKELTLSLSGRYDDVSDAGSQSVPKLGLVWSPHSDLRFRASYGESFKPPRFNQQNGRRFATLVTLDDPLADDGRSPVLVLSGSPSPGELRPETADALTVGFTYEPSPIPRLRIAATYFDVDFQNRVALPSIGNIFTVLEREESLTRFIARNPSGDQINDILEVSISGNFSTFFGDPFAEFEEAVAILDNRRTNVASEKVEGIDLNANYAWDTAHGDYNLFANVSYLLERTRQNDERGPVFDELDIPINPVDLRFRTGLSVSDVGIFDASIFLNYVDSYGSIEEDVPGVDSWTTIDGRVSLDIHEALNRSDFFSGTRLEFSIQNLLDEDPPALDPEQSGLILPVGFDPVNASPVGRFVSVRLEKRW